MDCWGTVYRQALVFLQKEYEAVENLLTISPNTQRGYFKSRNVMGNPPLFKTKEKSYLVYMTFNSE